MQFVRDGRFSRTEPDTGRVAFRLRRVHLVSCSCGVSIWHGRGVGTGFRSTQPEQLTLTTESLEREQADGIAGQFGWSQPGPHLVVDEYRIRECHRHNPTGEVHRAR